MKQRSKNLLITALLCLSIIVLFWKYFAMQLLPLYSPSMDAVLRYAGEPLSRSWVYFYRGNERFQSSMKEKETNLSGSIEKMDSAIDWYLESLNFHESREARENLKAAQNELRKLKEESSVNEQKKKEEEPPKENDSKNTKWDTQSWSESKSWESGSGSQSSDSGSGSTGSSWKTEKSNPSGKTTEWKEESNQPSSEWEPKAGPRGYTNSGTFSEGFSGSTSNSGLSSQDEKTLKNSLEFLKELQNQKGQFTRPKWVPDKNDGMWGIFEKYFWNGSLFENERDTDPYDY